MNKYEKYIIDNITLIKCWSIISLLFLTFFMTINFSVYIEYDGYFACDYYVKISYAIISIVIMFPIYMWMIVKQNVIEKVIGHNKNIKQLIITLYFSAFFSCKLVLELKDNKGKIIDALNPYYMRSILDKINEKILLSFIWLFVILGVFIFISFFVNYMYTFFEELYEERSKDEMIYFCGGLVVVIFVICFFYSRVYGQWNSIDLVFQTDTQFMYERYYPVFSDGYKFDYDIGVGGIRHPLATCYTYFIYAICYPLSILLFFIPNILPILYMIIQAVLLLVIVIILKRIFNNKWIYCFFSFSFPFVFYNIFLEKYVLCTFFLTVYFYMIYYEKEQSNKRFALNAATGMMITSAFLGFLCISKDKHDCKSVIKEYIMAGVSFVLLSISMGRIHYFIDFQYLLQQNEKMFYSNGVVNVASNGSVFLERCLAYLDFLASCFFPVRYQVNESCMMWRNIREVFNHQGAIILIVIIIAIKLIKKKHIRIALFWIAYSIVQFIVLGNGTSCAPLWNLYFAWAIIPVVVETINYLVKNKLYRNFIYVLFLTNMLLLNIFQLSDIYIFLLKKTPL